ncbi:MAG: hypothetical protein K0S08_1353 [Gammaproteobacteria bacterium]|jgi:hypothetical protein|nr:hypothetical protein [Gammaproteobacteria bacterium]
MLRQIGQRRVSFSLSDRPHDETRKVYPKTCFSLVRRSSQEKLSPSKAIDDLAEVQAALIKICQFCIKTLQAKSSETSPGEHRFEAAGRIQEIAEKTKEATHAGEIKELFQGCMDFFATVTTIYQTKQRLGKVVGLPSEPLSEIQEARKTIDAYLIATAKSGHLLKC